MEKLSVAEAPPAAVPEIPEASYNSADTAISTGSTAADEDEVDEEEEEVIEDGVKKKRKRM
jgi:hypothetical protein